VRHILNRLKEARNYFSETRRLQRARSDKGLQQRIQAFARANQEKPVPPREQDLLPEILIPCFNHGQFLETALTTIAHSRIPITIINDASTDDTPQRLEDLAGRYTFKAITNPANLLQSGSLNRAIEFSSNNLFIILNADDALLPFTINLILRLFHDLPEIRLFGGSSIWFDDDTVLRLNRYFPTELDYVPKLNLFTPEQVLNFQKSSDLLMTMSGSAVLRSAWQAVDGFKPLRDRIFRIDDRDFQLRVAALFPVVTVNEPVAYWRKNSSIGRAAT
jgi:glycosyltransferase involved in cell wall biosynthesis